MQFKVKSGALSSVLQRIAAAIEEKPVIPAYGGVKISVIGSRMVLSTFGPIINTEVHLEDVRSEGDIGFGLNLKLFTEVVQALPEEDLSFDVSGIDVKLRTARSSFKLPLLDDAAALPSPNLSGQSFAKLDLPRLIDSFAKVVYCHNDKAERIWFRAVCIDKDNIVSTDGFRLSYIPNKAFSLQDKAIILLTTPSVEKLIKIYGGIDGEAGIGSDGSALLLRAGGVFTSTRLANGNYPDYQSVLPKGPFAPVVIARRSLIESLKRVLVMSGEGGIKHVDLVFEAAGVTLKCQAGVGDSEDFLPAPIEAAGDVRLNGDFLLKSLLKMSAEKITIEYRGPQATVITDGEHVNVLQPIKRV